MQWLFRCYSDRDMIKYQCIKNKYRIHNIIYQFSQQLKDIMGSKLTKVIVYGSYARGEYNSRSVVHLKINEKNVPEYVKNVIVNLFIFTISRQTVNNKKVIFHIVS